MKPWVEWSDVELADEAQTGLRGQGAVVESLRRHREALTNQQAAATHLSWVMLFLALVGVVLTAVQVWKG